MSHPPFDTLWDSAPSTPQPSGGFDALWDGGKPSMDIHEQYRRGLLPKRMARENQNEAEQTAAEQPSLLDAVRNAVGGVGANLSRDIPGAEAAQAGVRSVLYRQPYREALSDIHRAEDALPGAVRAPTRIAGGVLAAAALPGSPMASGAAYGAAHGLLSSDPTEGIGQRAMNAGIEGAVGGVAGKAADLLGTGVRAALAKTPAAQRVALSLQRATESKPLYKAFRDLGDLGSTPELADLIGDGTATNPGLPIVRRAIDTVKGESPNLAKLPDTDARVLDAVYKRIGNKAFRAQNGFESGEAAQTLGEAMDKAAQAKGGSYTNALSAYRGPSRLMEAVSRGKSAVNNAVSGGGGNATADLTTSPEAFANWIQGDNVPPGERQAAISGILGQVKRRGLVAHLGLHGQIPIPFPSAALRSAGPLLDAAGDTGAGGILADLLRGGAVSQSTRLNPF